MTGNEYYEATQKQRRHERRIRETKREVHALQLAGLDDTSARLRLGNQQRKLKAYTDKHGLPRLPHREKAYGIGPQPRALRKDPRPMVIELPAGLTMSRHALGQSAARGVGEIDIRDAIARPLHKTGVRVDDRGRASYQIIGERATIAVNPNTDKVASTWKTKARLRRKYGNGSS